MNVLMVGVDKNRLGGMWSVAEIFLNNKVYNDEVELTYVATSTCGSIAKRLCVMLVGYFKIIFFLFIKKIEIVHIHMAEKGSVFRKGIVVYLAKFFNKKVLIQMHAGPFMDWFNSLSPQKKLFVKKILNKSDLVLVLGQYWKNQLKSIVVHSKIDVLYNGSYLPAPRKYNNKGKFILFLGMISEKKGVYDLLEAIKRVDYRLDSDIKVLLCGEDVSRVIEKKILNLGLSKRVKYAGWISNEKKEELFSNAQLCVLPSYSEALSMTVIEAMCHGIPIITTNITTMPELIGNIIELVEPGDIKALADLILFYSTHEEERSYVSKLLYSRALEHFSDCKCIYDTLHYYDKLLS